MRLPAFAVILGMVVATQHGSAQMVSSSAQAVQAQDSPKESDPPAQPEVTIVGAQRADVVSALADELIAQKFSLVRSGDYEAVFEKQGGILESIVAGSRYDAIPKYRLTFSLIVGAGSIRVLGTQALVTNPGSGFERQTALDAKKHRRGMQSLLEGVRSRAGHGTTTVVAKKDTAESGPPIEQRLTERQSLARDLADVIRLKGLSAPGGKDEEYYSRREGELVVRIAALDSAQTTVGGVEPTGDPSAVSRARPNDSVDWNRIKDAAKPDTVSSLPSR